MTAGIDRRRALTGAAAAGVGVPFLAACGGDEGSTSDSAEEPAGSSGGGPIGSTSDVPVGGGTVFGDQKVVVTQPSEGDFKAFTAVCTHQGCLVDTVENNEIRCPCHGSAFSSEDGSVVNGPAEAPLEAVEVTVDGDSITLA